MKSRFLHLTRMLLLFFDDPGNLSTFRGRVSKNSSQLRFEFRSLTLLEQNPELEV